MQKKFMSILVWSTIVVSPKIPNHNPPSGITALDVLSPVVDHSSHLVNSLSHCGQCSTGSTGGKEPMGRSLGLSQPHSIGARLA